MGDTKSGLDVPLVALQAADHLEGVIYLCKELGFHSVQSWHEEHALWNILLMKHMHIRDIHMQLGHADAWSCGNAGDDTADYHEPHFHATHERRRSPSEASTSDLSDDIDRTPPARNASSVLWGLFQRGHDVEGAVSCSFSWRPWSSADCACMYSIFLE